MLADRDGPFAQWDFQVFAKVVHNGTVNAEKIYDDTRRQGTAGAATDLFAAARRIQPADR